MVDEIRIDIGRYFDKHGKKPGGAEYWVFRIVSPLATAKDHIYAPQEQMKFKAGMSAGYRDRGSAQSYAHPATTRLICFIGTQRTGARNV